ncbi:hypothetical protein BT93_L4910 [Corymbia citriodora subsp. variegata]|uniref:Uncharacterized protein n=1 Tax=Corymbia citriodora subsp. variegata TaxID=360336 RepID=A0A8T0CX08_CORYI|nr:hypothetical protein BT93_L4910 [Corymbia citriodora subsp. variegata]
MRRGSFGGMGGGSNSMFRTLGRSVIRAGVAGGAGGGSGGGGGFQESFAASSNSSPTSPRSASGSGHKLSSSHQLSLNSATSPFSPCNTVPVSAASGMPTWLPFAPSSEVDEYEWVFADGNEDQKRSLHFDDFVLGSVPSTDEVHGAVSAIQQVFDSGPCSQYVQDRFSPYVDNDVDQVKNTSNLLPRVSSYGSEMDWIEPTLHLSNSRALQPCEQVYDAFHLLQRDPSVQRMVISLSSDKAVWDAVLNNEVVKELRESCQAAEISSIPDISSDESSVDSNEVVNVVRWMFDNTVAKVTELIEKITKLVGDLFQVPPNEEAASSEPADPFEEKLRMSFLLSVVVLLVVAVTRAHKA